MAQVVIGLGTSHSPLVVTEARMWEQRAISDFGAVQFAARRLKVLLDDLELASFIQTTGSRGMHVVVPLDRSAKFEEGPCLRSRARYRPGTTLSARTDH